LRLGLGLWQSVPATFAVEGLIVRGRDRALHAVHQSQGSHRTIAWWAFIALLVVL